MIIRATQKKMMSKPVTSTDDGRKVRSSGVSAGQPRFAGSDRQGRGRLVAALCAGPVPAVDVAAVMGWPDDPARADRVAIGLLEDGLAVREGPLLRLP